MRVSAIILAVLPFVPPAGFTQLVPQPIDYTVSPYVLKSSTHEFVVAEAFPTVTTQAQLVKAMHAVRQQFRDLPAAIGKLDQPARICGAKGVHGSYEFEENGGRFVTEYWKFISGSTGYSLTYVRPSKIAASAAVEQKLQKFCPGDESQMEVLHLAGFEIAGPPRHYHLAGDWVSRTLGGGIHEIVYLYGTDLDFDPSMHASFLKRNGFNLRSSLYVSHCGSPLQRESFSVGSGDDGMILEREFATVYSRTSVLAYWRDSNLPAAPQAENALKTFCISHAPLADFSGSWGGAGARLVVAGRTAVLTANCMQGAMLTTGANLESPDGRSFDLNGTILTGTAEREVRYTGSVAKGRMQLQIASAGTVLARFDLKRGSHGDLHPCPAGHRIAKS